MFLKLISASKAEQRKIEKLLDESSEKVFLFTRGRVKKLSEQAQFLMTLPRMRSNQERISIDLITAWKASFVIPNDEVVK